jgi:tRNA(Ile)-lysidine synthetase-like protein
MTTPNDDTLPLARAVGAFIDRHELLPAGPVVVALSGGPDSLCLLHLLADLAPRRGWRLTAAHLDHGLRPESAAEVEVVRAMAAARAAALRTERVDTPALAAAEGGGVEAAARRARYRFLAAVAADLGGAPVAVGHTQDDQAETLLLRLARGAGSTGLAAMRPLTLLRPDAWGAPDDAGPPLRVVRPLLATGRAEVEAEVARRGLTPLRDPSNADPAFARNRLRHHLLPAWQAFDPGIAARLARAADLLAEDEAYLEVETERAWQRLAHIARDERTRDTAVSLDRALFLAQPLALQRRLLRRVAATLGSGAPTLAAIDGALAVAKSQAGGSAHLGARSVLNVDAARLWFGSKPPPVSPWTTPGACLPLAMDEVTALSGDAWSIICRRIAATACDAPLTGLHAHFVPALAGAAPHLRTWRRGDRIALPGLGGRKKLSDFFIDRKVPRAERDGVPLLVAGDTIAWIVGHAVGEPYRATGAEPTVLCCTAEKRDS